MALFFKFLPVDHSKLQAILLLCLGLLGYRTLYHGTVDVPQICLLLNRNLRHNILGKPLLSSVLCVFIHYKIGFL